MLIILEGIYHCLIIVHVSAPEWQFCLTTSYTNLRLHVRAYTCMRPDGTEIFHTKSFDLVVVCLAAGR